MQYCLAVLSALLNYRSEHGYYSHGIVKVADCNFYSSVTCMEDCNSSKNTQGTLFPSTETVFVQSTIRSLNYAALFCLKVEPISDREEF